MKTHLFTLVVVGIVLLGGCKGVTEKVKEDLKPIARGDADEIVLVIDSLQWAGAVGDELKSMYQSYMRVLPQDEFEFTLHKVNPIKLNDLLRNARNMIFVMTLDSKTKQSNALRQYFTDNSLKMIQGDSSLFYTVRKDEFARGQMVLYLFGQTEEALVKKLKSNKSGLVELFESAVRERVLSQILAQTKKDLMKSIEETHDYKISVPFGWEQAKNEADFLWLRKLEAASELNVFVYETDYKDREVFNHVDTFRDEITSTFLRDSEKPDLYIDRQAVIPVFTKHTTFNGRFAVEARGLWMVSDASAGGPFVSYTFVDEKTQKLYYIEGYVYAPDEKKKPLIREVEAILSTFHTDSETAGDSL